MILAAAIGFGMSANAQSTSYTVTVYTLKTLHYYDENDAEIGTTSGAGTSQVITICAKTEYEAEQQAIAECDRMCKSSYLKMEPSATYQGKTRKVRSTIEPSSTKIVNNQRSCS